MIFSNTNLALATSGVTRTLGVAALALACLTVTGCASRNGGASNSNACARHDQCRTSQACVLGECVGGDALNQPMSVSELFANQWYANPGGNCAGDTDCGPWACHQNMCTDPLIAEREMPPRRDFAYYDTSCRSDLDCGGWACVTGWCRDRSLLCGDGVLQDVEECDDGNDIDTDLCRNSCIRPSCGDGITSNYLGNQRIAQPVVTNPFGRTGHVCDDGGSTYNATMDLRNMPNAPEHGICEALGFARALSVTWGNGPGENDLEMPHAYNWECANFDCVASSNDYSADNCSRSEMLDSIECEATHTEQCDLGANNSYEPGAACRPDCSPSGCGDGIVDPGEECDDGNDNDSDACTSLCGPAYCGDGLRQRVIGEQCDDGNNISGDGCDTGCQREGDGCTMAIVDDSGVGMYNVGVVLEQEAFVYDLLDNSSGIYTMNISELDTYDLVVFNEYNRALDPAEQVALNAFVDGGGVLILTGYDSMGSPTDYATADVCHVTTAGDGPFDSNVIITDATHPAFDGPYGTYAQGTTIVVPGSDHDSVTATAALGSVQLMSVGGAAKLTFADNVGAGRGAVYYWNGNANLEEWSTPGVTQSIFLNLLAAECY